MTFRGVRSQPLATSSPSQAFSLETPASPPDCADHTPGSSVQAAAGTRLDEMSVPDEDQQLDPGLARRLLRQDDAELVTDRRPT
jgi:hypothetical protein